MLLPVLLAMPMAVAGCAIQPDGSPREIPEEDQAAFVADRATGGAAEGSSLIFLVAPQEPGQPPQLRSVMRGVDPQLTPVLRALFDGPNTEEIGSDLSSAIPTDLDLIDDPRQTGRTWIVDVNDGLDQLDAVDLRTALAQVVATATAVDGVDEVEIRVNGQDRQWPQGDGALTDQPLTPYDFPGLVESTQPPYPSLSSSTR
ncbi:MAG: GerMN domain-containing protein [Ilumatobacteraceae bacterium]